MCSLCNYQQDCKRSDVGMMTLTALVDEHDKATYLEKFKAQLIDSYNRRVKRR